MMKFLIFLRDKFFSTSAAGLYMILFAAAIGIATFIENDFGTSAAQKVIFKTKWFELLLILFGITLMVNIWRFRMIKQKKWAVLTFHAAMVIILIGAGVTRYFGYEGMMSIREGSSSNTFLSADTYMIFEAMQNGKRFRFHEPVLFASLGQNKFKESYQIGSDKIDVELLEFIPNPSEIMERDDQNGLPTLKIVIGGANGREEYYVQESNRSNIRGTLFNFDNTEVVNAFNLRYDADGQLFFKVSEPFMQTVMATQKRDTIPPNEWRPLMLRSLYTNGKQSFVFGDFLPKASVKVQSTAVKITNQSMGGLRLLVSINGQANEVMVTGSKGVEGRPRVLQGGKTSLAAAYGSKRVELPFSIALRDFILEKYPGTDNASSYASEVTLIDPRSNVNRQERIFMNNILDHGGYRFFQSSFDPDELGTYLSVNYDFWGTWISYLGYALLTIGMVLTLFDKKSRFRSLGEKIKQLREA